MKMHPAKKVYLRRLEQALRASGAGRRFCLNTNFTWTKNWRNRTWQAWTRMKPWDGCWRKSAILKTWPYSSTLDRR
ncbi:hypothetical protein GCM10007416_15800 [Kroppenstedtia guangzhouensis]|uniref:Uncharacterized protein n=1 Tax=Kroppenstedtia guangzhouensis TaxID=1274356 RepID=A0ABQ1GH55_9BACL|nr:hypothetical protein GCM10007416_15800 [Kroppenstedtia guangzhouensis]